MQLTRIVLLAALVPATARAESYFAGYLGEFGFHPGVFGGVELPVAQRGRWSAHAAAVGGTYVHVRNHVGARISGELGGRVALGRRVTVDGAIGLGYLHTFLAADVYEVDDGMVQRVTDLGRPSLMPTVALGVSVAVGRSTPFARVEMFGQYPYNEHLLPHVALLIGVRR